MNYIEWFGTNFIGLFEAGGKQFVSFMTGIVPLLIVLLTFTYSIIAFIGEERVNRAIQFSAKNMILRYTLMPVLSVLMLTNPMAYTFGRFVKEHQKPAFMTPLYRFCTQLQDYFHMRMLVNYSFI